MKFCTLFFIGLVAFVLVLVPDCNSSGSSNSRVDYEWASTMMESLLNDADFLALSRYQQLEILETLYKILANNMKQHDMVGPSFDPDPFSPLE